MRALILIGALFLLGCPEPVVEDEPPLAAGGCCLPTTGGCADGPSVTAAGCDGRFWIGRTCNATNTACE